uniref:Uncharacterized protein n=1 Tax=Sphingobacterium sp. (strain 21) TaxID=743722 RepID=F4CE70_SPHS2
MVSLHGVRLDENNLLMGRLQSKTNSLCLIDSKYLKLF